MKKLLLFVLLFTIITPIYSEEKLDNYSETLQTTSKGIETVYDDVKSMSPKISKALTSLSKELKVGVNALWDILVKQQLVWSIVFLMLTITSIFNWFIFYYKNFKKYNPKDLKIGQEEYLFKTENPEFCQEYYDKYKDKSSVYQAEKQDIRFKKTIDKVLKRDCYIYPNSESNGLKYFKYLHLLICLILSILSFYHFTDMMTGFINPEYGAIKTIAEVAIKLK